MKHLHNILQATIAAAIGVGVVVLVAYFSAGGLRAAEFGAAWTNETGDALAAATTELTALSYNGQKWAIGGDQATTTVSTVYSSSGSGFSSVGNLPGARKNHCSVVFDNKMVVIGGIDNSSVYHDDVWSSTDGITWTVEGTIPSNRANHACTVKDDKVWIAGGYDGVDQQDDVYNSSDLSTWASVGTIPTNRARGQLVTLNDVMYFIGGETADPVDNVYSSSDGVTWNDTGVLPGVRSRGGAVVAGGRIYYVAGITGSGSRQDDVFATSSGVSWVDVGNGAFPVDIANFAMTMHQGKAWVLGGTTGTQQSTVYSTDEVAGLVTMPQEVEGITDFGEAVTFTDQSSDTATSEIPLLKIAAKHETDSGFPFLMLTIIIIYAGLAIGTCFMLGKMAPDNKWVTVLVVMGFTAIAFAMGREMLDWYIFLALGGLLFGSASIGSQIQG